MPENVPKMPRSVSPAAKAGAGDISERELSRERNNLQTTPPTRIQPAHPKKQLFSTPVNKFTAKCSAPSPNLARIRSCLEEFRAKTPARPVKMAPKAVSMEDLTPTKRIRRERKENDLPRIRSPGVRTLAEEQAAARIGRFMMVVAWRRRREEVKCLRKTLEFQVSCSERLRIQVSALKSLLDSDNAKVRLAMKELERLKQLLKDKDLEKAILEREKLALEDDVCAAEDRISDMSIGWRNTRNELEGVRAAVAVCEHALQLERAACADARAQRDHAYERLNVLEDELAEHEDLLTNAEAEVAALRREAADRQQTLEDISEQLKLEQRAREQCSVDCAQLSLRVSLAAAETNALKEIVEDLRGELARMGQQLAITREQLDWWPRPLTRMLGLARSWFRYPMTFPEAIMWTMVPARHGC
ncbi:hypothetical protein K1T71_009027 [Dendrolimus kikuchii]|uniref:Uncharacterized protein n=1 Tax=Dendrolimus kikuchii TaxID=765133 RepID=A0ACC1CW37_9NEOP|nr:hypothetical protein K1T71_009027 [Dendrolimus kikuchii]